MFHAFLSVFSSFLKFVLENDVFLLDKGIFDVGAETTAIFFSEYVHTRVNPRQLPFSNGKKGVIKKE